MSTRENPVWRNGTLEWGPDDEGLHHMLATVWRRHGRGSPWVGHVMDTHGDGDGRIIELGGERGQGLAWARKQIAPYVPNAAGECPEHSFRTSHPVCRYCEQDLSNAACPSCERPIFVMARQVSKCVCGQLVAADEDLVVRMYEKTTA